MCARKAKLIDSQRDLLLVKKIMTAPDRRIVAPQITRMQLASARALNITEI